MVLAMESMFDTLACTRRLTQAGVDSEHAEAMAAAPRAAFNEGVATKADLARLETTLTLRFGALIAVAVAVIKFL